MRARVMANGAFSLADYELIEMLLFLGIPRRDTKPLAKGLLQEFGSLLNVLRASGHKLREMGLSDDAIRALRLPSVAAERLAGMETRDRPILGNWSQLLAYLEVAALGAVPGQLRFLYLDNRNRLLADEVPAISGNTADVLRRALVLQAVALIGVEFGEGANVVAASAHRVFLQRLEAAGRPLAVTLHDAVWKGLGAAMSFRQEGWL